MSCVSPGESVGDCTWAEAPICGSTQGVVLTCSVPSVGVDVRLGVVRRESAHLGLSPPDSVFEGAVVARVDNLGSTWHPVCSDAMHSTTTAQSVCLVSGYSSEGASFFASERLENAIDFTRFRSIRCATSEAGTTSCTAMDSSACDSGLVRMLRC